MNTEQFANNVQTTLDGSINDSATSLDVASAAGFPNVPNFRIQVDNELMIVTAVSGVSWTVARGAEGSSPAAHEDGACVTQVLTAAAVQNIGMKKPVRVATAAVLPNSPTYSGSTKRITAGSNGALTVDGASVAVGERVLVKNQATGSQNGIYIVITVGDGSNPYVLERASDFWASPDVTPSSLVAVSEGTANADTIWQLTTNAPITLDTTALSFAISSGGGGSGQWKQSVRVATTVNGTLSSAFENGDTVDGVTLTTGDRILIKNQTTASENGIYIVSASGAPARASDLAAGVGASGATIYVDQGTANAESVWFCTTNAGSDVVGTNNLTFARLGAGGPGLLNVQVFTSSGTFTKTVGCTKAIVEVQGPGGGGGGTNGGAGAGSAAACGGGGGGGYCKKLVDLNGISTATITVGTGGAGGAGSSSSNGSAGSGASSYADGTNTLTGNAGSGGTGTTALSTSFIAAAGGGGTATGGDVNINGLGGMAGSVVSGDLAQLGAGGHAQLGRGARAVVPGGNAGNLYGGGGAGATSQDDTTDRDGGGGANGVVIIWEYGFTSTAFDASINSLATVTPARNDYIAIADTSDGGNNKKALVSDFCREILTASRTYYVRTDGSDSNDGLTDNAGGAFLTIQKAIDVASAIDNGGFDITIQVRDGTYTAANTLKSFVGSGQIIIRGNNSTPANVVISTTSATCFTASGVVGQWSIRDLKMQTTTAGYCLNVSGCLVTVGNVNFGAAASGYSHVLCSGLGQVTFISNYTISGGTAVHWNASVFGRITATGLTITLSGTPAFSAWFAVAQHISILNVFGNTFSGSATGTRYSSAQNSEIYTNGGGASYLPGNVNGSTATGGLYL